MFLAKSPDIVKKYYPRLIWDIENEEQKIYLTFDDGPTPEITLWVLDLLKKYRVKATFFCVGSNVEKHPDIYQQIIDEGHQVGNHSYDHLNGWYANDENYFNNIDQANKLVNSTLFRPPYGRIRKRQIKELVKTYKIIMWDVLSGDFDPKKTPEKCLNNVIQNTKTGSIIVFHDSIKASENLKYALPKAIEYLLAQGFVFEVLPD